MNGPTGMGFGTRLGFTLGDAGHLGWRLREGHPCFKRAHRDEVSRVLGPPVFWLVRIRTPDLGLCHQRVARWHLRPAWKIEANRHHTNDRVALVVDVKGLSNDLRVTAKAPLPQRVADYRNFVSS